MTAAAPTRHDVEFSSSGELCRAWLFLPEPINGALPPVVVMGHGLGGTREDGLEPFARRFADAGIAALVFTYRHFGDSEGQPRLLVDITAQLADWAAALAYVRGLDTVDTSRVAVWGSSFGGGHVLEVAARDGQLRAVVAQCPFTDGLAATRTADPRSLLRSAVPALRDEVARLRGRPPVMVALVGPPGSAAMMTSPDSEAGYRALLPSPDAFPNAIPARFLSRVGLYRPGRSARRITAPVLFCICDDDAVAPAEAALAAARSTPRAEVKRYPIGHFDIYRGAPFQRAVTDQTEFLVRHLLAP